MTQMAVPLASVRVGRMISTGPSSAAGHPPSSNVRPGTRCSCDLPCGSLNEERVQKGSTTRQTGHVPCSVFRVPFCNEQRQDIVPKGVVRVPSVKLRRRGAQGFRLAATETTPAPPHDIPNTTKKNRHFISTVSSVIRERTYLATMQGSARRAAIPPSLPRVAPFDIRQLFVQHGDVPASTVFGGCKPFALRSAT